MSSKMLSAKSGDTDAVTRLAVLIDAENVSDRYTQYIFEELAGYADLITYKRIYGDWTTGRLNSWKKVLLDYSITPIQQYSYTMGKNSTDSALIIDAMDILYNGDVDSFCIVSSDSDFTRLAARLREAGKCVIGMGEKKTPKPFISACQIFRYLEIISREEQSVENSESDLNDIADEVQRIVDEFSDDSGWVFLGSVGNQLEKKLPDFDVRNYGFSKLTALIKATKRFRIESRQSGDAAPLTYIGNK